MDLGATFHGISQTGSDTKPLLGAHPRLINVTLFIDAVIHCPTPKPLISVTGRCKTRLRNLDSADMYRFSGTNRSQHTYFCTLFLRQKY